MPQHAGVDATRLGSAGVLAVVTPLGLASKLYAGPGASWVAGHAGGFFYVLFWIFLLLLIVPGVSVRTVTVCVLGITSALEVLQLWHVPILESLRSTFLGHALLGSTFSWSDFLCYGLAALIAPGLARRTRSWASGWLSG